MLFLIARPIKPSFLPLHKNIMKKKYQQSESQIAGMISINIGKTSSEKKALQNYTPEHTLVMPTRNLVLFPGVALPIQLGRESSVKVAEFARTAGIPVAVICQRSPEIDEPEIDDLYNMGTLARIIDIISLPNGIKTAIVEGIVKVRIVGKSEAETLPGVIAARVKKCKESPGEVTKEEFENVLARVKELSDQVVKNMGDEMAEMRIPQIDKIDSPAILLNTMAVHLPFDVEDKQEMLEANTLVERAWLLTEKLALRIEQMKVMQDIMAKTRSQMEDGQRNAFLQQQMDVIRQELEGDETDEIDELEEKALKANLPDPVRQRFAKELRKLRRYNPSSPDYAVQYSYLDTLASLPWVDDEASKFVNFKDACWVLEKDHFGLKKVKDRILEQVAQILHNPDAQAPILCFVGPPGVGKTSLGKSIANALGRQFQRVSLGGLHDEAEIRGHRRTYIGAMPGRIIEAMRRAETHNPVIMLDEIDKIGADFKGDPAAALLEVLDPAQNYHFHDNYIDVDYDLSQVMFIATANTLSTISKPLLDRIEVIELSGYTVEEKIEIAVRHIIPRLRMDTLIGGDTCSFRRSVIKTIIEDYTSESGVRQLEKILESIMRKKLRARMLNAANFTPNVKASDLLPLLGPAPYHRDKYEGNSFPGVVTGLAWTSVGGEILLVEAALSPGKGVLTLTGNLGDVMKESANLALEWIKVNAQKLGIDAEVFKNNDVHVHFPEGAVPKDGPSAGITIVTAIVSAITGRLMNPYIAMTGEITLRGKVIPVGGIKEKILAAKRAGIKHIIISEENRSNVNEIGDEYLKGLDFIYVKTVDDVLRAALQP